MSVDFSLSPLIAATARWLTRAYPAGGGVLDRAVAEAQARQAVTVAAWLRYPTTMDAALVAVAGPGGSERLDGVTGADTAGRAGEDGEPWRSWVDEVVVSWAAALLGEPGLAAAATEALAGSPHTAGAPVEFRRLLDPGEHERRAAALLRHPDLLAPVADLHRDQLLDRLAAGPALTG
ncbi:hypothetical protein [Streptomyces ficellus]|uniref:Uncharacterized protein n=1 Tax=Streptomyces ficellus TaxID=1977088 RepID=A0A6I6F9Z5_9ACTN|nr:hypothetical protein [Streptomyces ficellus]QGV77747.1 hypothetical protein EIZ62_05410 [Streptomyces ficellus]